ncbi:MAG: aromatic amino acid lyase, partial [Acidimicrobiales bacterium]
MTRPDGSTLPPVVVGAGGVPIAGVVAVARGGAQVVVGSDAEAAMVRSHELAAGLIEGDRAVYGLSTGFGALADRYIRPTERANLQASLVRSHAATVGAEIEPEVTRAMVLLRAATLAKGYSGIRPDLVHGLVALLHAGLTPVVREHGSLGCSGDLAPLAHVGLALIGEGEVTDARGRRLPAAAALRDAAISPLVLEAKEGLALTNGTDGMLAHLCLAVTDAERLLRTADVAAAMSVEGLLGTDQAFRAELIALRPHPG